MVGLASLTSRPRGARLWDLSPEACRAGSLVLEGVNPGAERSDGAKPL